MKFTIQNLLSSLAGGLKTGYPDRPVYTSPNQQGTEFPCFFIFLMPSSIEDGIGGRFLRDLGLDLVFVQQRNAANGNAEIQEVQEFLDQNLDKFLYYDESGSSAWLHTYEREASVEDQELHYKFHVRPHVSAPIKENQMQGVEENHVKIK